MCELPFVPRHMILIVVEMFLFVYNAASVWLGSQMVYKCMTVILGLVVIETHLVTRGRQWVS